MKPLVTHEKISLPSGGTCVVRALSGLDYANMKHKPKAFPSQQELEAVATGQAELDDRAIEAAALFMEAILLHCTSPITWGDERKKLIQGKDLDELLPNEMLIEELPQDDATAIVAAASRLSHTTKEAGQTLGNFPEGPADAGDSPHAG